MGCTWMLHASLLFDDHASMIDDLLPLRGLVHVAPLLHPLREQIVLEWCKKGEGGGELLPLGGVLLLQMIE